MIDLRLGDCLEVMKTIEDNSIDFICCDLPYGSTANRWDESLDFELMWIEYKRIIKELIQVNIKVSLGQNYIKNGELELI